MKQQPRTGPIVWGTLLLALCVWVGGRTFFPGVVSGEVFLILTAIGLGVLLLGIGIAVAVRNHRPSDETELPPSVGE